MKNGIFALVMVAMTFMTLTINATPIKLIHFTVDISSAYGELIAHKDEQGDIEKFEWVIVRSDPEDPKQGGFFTPEELREGELFDSGLPKKFVTVEAENFSNHNGGEINISVPKSIITGSKIHETVVLDRVGDEWVVNHTDTDEVKTVHVIVKKKFGVPIGVTEINFLD